MADKESDDKISNQPESNFDHDFEQLDPYAAPPSQDDVVSSTAFAHEQAEEDLYSASSEAEAKLVSFDDDVPAPVKQVAPEPDSPSRVPAKDDAQASSSARDSWFQNVDPRVARSTFATALTGSEDHSSSTHSIPDLYDLGDFQHCEVTSSEPFSSSYRVIQKNKDPRFKFRDKSLSPDYDISTSPKTKFFERETAKYFRLLSEEKKCLEQVARQNSATRPLIINFSPKVSLDMADNNSEGVGSTSVQSDIASVQKNAEEKHKELGEIPFMEGISQDDNVVSSFVRSELLDKEALLASCETVPIQDLDDISKSDLDELHSTGVERVHSGNENLIEDENIVEVGVGEGDLVKAVEKTGKTILDLSFPVETPCSVRDEQGVEGQELESEVKSGKEIEESQRQVGHAELEIVSDVSDTEKVGPPESESTEVVPDLVEIDKQNDIAKISQPEDIDAMQATPMSEEQLSAQTDEDTTKPLPPLLSDVDHQDRGIDSETSETSSGTSWEFIGRETSDSPIQFVSSEIARSDTQAEVSEPVDLGLSVETVTPEEESDKTEILVTESETGKPEEDTVAVAETDIPAEIERLPEQIAVTSAQVDVSDMGDVTERHVALGEVDTDRNVPETEIHAVTEEDNLISEEISVKEDAPDNQGVAEELEHEIPQDLIEEVPADVQTVEIAQTGDLDREAPVCQQTSDGIVPVISSSDEGLSHGAQDTEVPLVEKPADESACVDEGIGEIPLDKGESDKVVHPANVNEDIDTVLTSEDASEDALNEQEKKETCEGTEVDVASSAVKEVDYDNRQIISDEDVQLHEISPDVSYPVEKICEQSTGDHLPIEKELEPEPTVGESELNNLEEQDVQESLEQLELALADQHDLNVDNGDQEDEEGLSEDRYKEYVSRKIGLYSDTPPPVSALPEVSTEEPTHHEEENIHERFTETAISKEERPPVVEPEEDTSQNKFPETSSSAEDATVSEKDFKEPHSLVSGYSSLADFREEVKLKTADLVPSVVVELVYWRDIKKSAIAFSSIMMLLISLATFSVLSVVAYMSLAVLTVTLSFRIYKNVLQAVQKTSDGHPFKQYLSVDVTIPTDKVHEYADNLNKHLECTMKVLRRLILVEDLVDSVKFGLLLWVMTYIGAWFNGMTLIILGVIGIFTIPKVYETYKVQIDQYLDIARTQISQVMKTIQDKVPFPGKKKTQ